MANLVSVKVPYPDPLQHIEIRVPADEWSAVIQIDIRMSSAQPETINVHRASAKQWIIN